MSQRCTAGVLWGVVVDDQMHVEVLGDAAVDQVQEADELLGPVAGGEVGDHQSRRHVQRGVQVGGAVPAVVVAGPLRAAGQQRQHRGGAIERLDLGLLIDAQHHRRIGRVQVQPDDVTNLVDELRVRRQLEAVGEMRLEPERPPDLRHRRLGHPRRLGHRPRRPVRRIRRGLLERLDDHPLDVGIAHRARRTGTGIVPQTVETQLDEPTPPLADGVLVHPEAAGDLPIGRPFSAGQHDPTTCRQRVRALRASRPALQRLALIVAQHERFSWSSSSGHRCLPSLLTTTRTRTRTRKFLRTRNSGH